ncbi:MAG: hypothetical protein IJ849_11460 [Selenomonadaceae bacterium]|nr:hypothetical protein [Selenomonadaceae bacterium]
MVCLGVGAGGVLLYFGSSPPPPTAMSEEERESLVRQQAIFAQWNEEYQKKIDQLDYNWQSYHNILAAFQEDSISIQTTYLRLRQLEDDARTVKEDLSRLTVPRELNDTCYHSLTLVLNKTQSYAEAQHRAIALTKAAADPEHLRSENQAEQSADLQTVMMRESPTGLFTAKEMYVVRKSLALPEEEGGSADNPSTNNSTT